MNEEILLDNLNQIKENINQHSPYPDKVKIIAVTKNFSHHAIISAVKQNVVCIGENRVQEFFNKKEKLKNINIEAHLIGHLQSNKINKALKIFDIIQTIDTFKIANKINQKLKKSNHQKGVFLQLNLAQDNNKYGFSNTNLWREIEEIQKLENIKIKGIMTILPFLENVQNTEKMFEKIRLTAEEIKQKIAPQCDNLSMGMSRDYVYALKQGATHIRIGTMLYGKRKY